MANISSRIDALIEKLGAQDRPAELKSDAEIAKDLCHIFLCSVREGEEADDDTVALAKLVVPEITDHRAWLKEMCALRPDAYAVQQWETWKKNQRVHPGSSLEQFIGTATTTRITRQRPMSEEERITSAEFERERAANMGKSELMNGGGRQTRAIMGPRSKR